MKPIVLLLLCLSLVSCNQKKKQTSTLMCATPFGLIMVDSSDESKKKNGVSFEATNKGQILLNLEGGEKLYISTASCLIKVSND